jgi:hypothetical protein
MSTVAEEARLAVAGKINPLENQLTQTLNPEQKIIWLNLEEAIFEEMNLIQELTVKKYRCPICPGKTTCMNSN